MELWCKRLLTATAYIMCLLIMWNTGAISAQRTFLDKYIHQYRTFREELFKFVGRTDTEASYRWNLKRQVNKPNVQKLIDYDRLLSSIIMSYLH